MPREELAIERRDLLGKRHYLPDQGFQRGARAGWQWAALLFFCFGLLATFNWISFLAQLLGSLAVAAAFFMILEFSSPYSGLFRISPIGIDGLIRSAELEVEGYGSRKVAV